MKHPALPLLAIPLLWFSLPAGAQNQPAATASPYQAWARSGSFTILTTAEGANLPASAVVEDFPLLVRLDQDGFDFKQAKTMGEDLRFSTATGSALAYQVEEWDAARGIASVWVRIPRITGMARQEIIAHWGKPDAVSESNGKAVFNAANGFLSVWHMTEPVADEVGTLASKDTGTTPTVGIIGKARHFGGSQGIFGGDKITTYPTGASPHSSEAWFRAEISNGNLLGWGNEERQGKVIVSLASPPHIRVDAYFSGANVTGGSTLPMAEWTHVVHTYTAGQARLYVNGVLDGETNQGTPLALKSPARLWLGGWYNNYNFVGDLDEVRVSNVVRSADWVKLQYENQKRFQTLVGPIIQPGSAFGVVPASLTILEGGNAVITAQAGGAQKLTWTLTADGKETVIATDRLAVTLEAGRVTADKTASLQFKAVYADKVKTVEIPVTLKEDIPEPVFSVKVPAAWDGRSKLEIVPQIANLSAMRAKGAGDLKVDWSVSGIATIKKATADKLTLIRAQNSGTLVLTATLSNGGKPSTQTARITVTEPKQESWIARIPDKDEQPADGQFYARDDRNEGTLFYNGTLDQAVDSVFLKVYADDRLDQRKDAKPAADGSYALAVRLKPGLVKYKVEFGTLTGGRETLVRTVGNLVCGDAYLIQGQSNALATDTREESPRETSEWIRSYGRPPANPQATPANLWCRPVWKAGKDDPAELGYWGMELAKRLVASQKMPICLINGAVGGTRIDQHQRNEAEPTDLTTIYGRTLWRVQQARLTHGIRGILWHQGENNQGAASPTGDYDWKSYQHYFVELSAAWKQDFPNLQHYYVFQIWPNACSMAGDSGAGDRIREIQRTLPRLYSNLSVMSTLGIKPPGGCHFPLVGWAEFARLIQPLIERDHYGKRFAEPITPANLTRAHYTRAAQDEIALEFDQPVIWLPSLGSQINLDGDNGRIASGAVSGNVLILKLKAPATARTITYLKETSWSPDELIYGVNGIAALTFCEVPLEPAKPNR